MGDILFKTQDYVFSYRIAGICLQDGKVLLQRPVGDVAHAFPGGHAAFGETNEQTLKREFREELGVDISVGQLKWVGEIFFPWDNRDWHQICLYYMVEICTEDFPRDGTICGKDLLDEQDFDMEFRWVPLQDVKNLVIYPEQAPQLLEKLDEGVQHFIFRE